MRKLFTEGHTPNRVTVPGECAMWFDDTGTKTKETQWFVTRRMAMRSRVLNGARLLEKQKTDSIKNLGEPLPSLLCGHCV